MTTKTTTVYIAYDGTVFEDETECECYEKGNLLNRLSHDCIFLDDAERPVSVEEFFNNPAKVGGIYAPNEEQAKVIHQILVEREFESPWDEDPSFTPGFYWYNYNDRYENVERSLKYWQNIYNSFQDEEYKKWAKSFQGA